jgi:hypothetical protein
MSGEPHAQVFELWLGESSYQSQQEQKHPMPDQATLRILHAHTFLLIKADEFA